MTSSRSSNFAFIIFGVVVILLFAASFVPQWRLWGVNWWGYLPLVSRLGLLIVAAAGGLAVHFWMRSLARGSEQQASGNQSWLLYALIAAVITVLFGASFVVFRATTHFLGDGYQLLARLADQVPSKKAWDMGASMLHDQVFALLGGESSERALRTYRLVSTAGGLAFLLAAAVFSGVLFRDTVRRVLFLLGLATAGYLLMFFGYVENYAWLIAAILLFTLTGIAASAGKLSHWWLLVPFGLALFLHAFALFLVPSLVYLLARKTQLGGYVRTLATGTRRLIGAILLVLLAAAYIFLYHRYYFFTFALLPVVPDRLTVEGDFLLSPKHFLDLANLLVMLLPGLPLFVVHLAGTLRKDVTLKPVFAFLLILLVSTLAPVYLLNPGIGMPRNWDLFAIVGVPLAVMAYFLTLDSPRAQIRSVRVAALGIVLGLVILAPRVGALHVPELGLAHFKNYLQLDVIRNRNARRLLLDFYEARGDTAAARVAQQQIDRDFPESGLNNRAKHAIGQGKYDEAAGLLRRAIDLNPLYYDAYANLGVCCLNRGQLDSALTLFEIADGLNPYNASTINNIGTVYLRSNKPRRAVKYFLEALRVDSTNESAMMGLAAAYVNLGEYDRSLAYVTRLYQVGELPYEYFRQAGDAYSDKGAIPEAKVAYGYAVQLGLDPGYVRRKLRE